MITRISLVMRELGPCGPTESITLRDNLAATEPTAGAVGHSLTASCMHTGSDVFVILKPGGRPG
jgi:hypothetical protein